MKKIGTYQLAIVAQFANKPLYVVAESYKFVNRFPLSQMDSLPNFRLEWSADEKEDLSDTKIPFKSCRPAIDYTPPHLISILFTDLGILTPSDVSEHLYILD